MPLLKSLAVAGIAIAALTTPTNAAESRSIAPTRMTAQAQPTARQVLDACVQNRAETLPNPFVDVSPTHWAYKSVLTMYYCGAYRQATPPSLIERLLNTPTPQQGS